MTASKGTDGTVLPSRGRWVVTGSGGFIARHLIRRLREADCDVLALDLREGPLPSGVRFVACDITDRGSVERAVQGFQPDFSVHLAAMVGDWGPRSAFEAVNVQGTRHVLETLRSAGVRTMVHISSIAAMGFAPGYAADESVMPVLDTDDWYSRTKAEGELVARELQKSGSPIIIVRPGDVYGPGCEPWVRRPLRMMRAGQMILVDGGRGIFAHVWVHNLIDGILAAMQREASLGRTYVLTDGVDDTTIGNYFTRLGELCNAPPPRISMPRFAARNLAGVLEMAARRIGFTPPFTRGAVDFVTRACSYSIARARRELGYAPAIGLQEGLSRIAAAEREGNN